MKTIKIFFASFLFILLAHTGFAQKVTRESFKVSGQCGSCKKHIEQAAKEAGATYAEWNKTTKVLTVKYDASHSSTAKIQQGIAQVGYDTPGYKATDDAYNNLEDCCKYNRTAAKTTAANCCNSAQCTKADCAKGACDKDMNCCKNETCTKDNCCKKA